MVKTKKEEKTRMEGKDEGGRGRERITNDIIL
jgi:hypothetical protein